MKQVVAKAVGFVVRAVEKQVEQQVALRVFDDRRIDFGLKN